MKSEKGITMLVLVVTMVILMIITAVVIYTTMGPDGSLVATSREAFKSDIKQIIELMKERETLYNLEEIKDGTRITEAVKGDILQDYYDKLDIFTTYSEEDGLELKLVYKPECFSEDQKKWLNELGVTIEKVDN